MRTLAMNIDDYTDTTVRFEREQQVCALVQDLLPLYLEGEVSPASTEQVAAHLEQCPNCAGYLSGMRQARIQFERERRERAAGSRAGDAERRTLSRWRSIALGIAALFLCLCGGLAGTALLNGLINGDDAIIPGVILSPLFLGGLWKLAQLNGPLVGQRRSRFFNGIALAIMASGWLASAGDMAPMGILPGMAAAWITISAILMRPQP